MIEKRNSLNKEEVLTKSAAIFEKLCSMKQYASADVVHVYFDYRNEVRTLEFIQRCLREGKRVTAPKVEAGYLLSAYEINDIEKDIIKGFKGIPEPDSSRLERIDPCEIDLAVVPGVAFDRLKRRIGYGAGYYDRFLPLLRTDCVKIGVAYEFQVMEALPADKYDIPVDMVITEATVIR